jgi:Zn-dependent protease
MGAGGPSRKAAHEWMASAIQGRQAMPDASLILIVLVVIIVVMSLGIHEAAHAWVAYKRGDSTARDLGRMTINPIVHIDPFLTIILPTIMMLTMGWPFGGAKPVPVVAANLKHPVRDMMWVALAGPASNFLQAIVFEVVKKSVLLAGDYEKDTLFVRVMNFGVLINVLLALFNLLPIPPLDGSRVMSYLLPRSMRESFEALDRFGILIVLAVIWFVPGGSQFLMDGVSYFSDLIYWMTGGQWS